MLYDEWCNVCEDVEEEENNDGDVYPAVGMCDRKDCERPFCDDHYTELPGGETICSECAKEEETRRTTMLATYQYELYMPGEAFFELISEHDVRPNGYIWRHEDGRAFQVEKDVQPKGKIIGAIVTLAHGKQHRFMIYQEKQHDWRAVRLIDGQSCYKSPNNHQAGSAKKLLEALTAWATIASEVFILSYNLRDRPKTNGPGRGYGDDVQ